MKSFSQMACILASCLFLMCNNSIETTAQGIAGEWLIDGTEMSVHFSEEGAMLLTVPEYEGRQGIYYIEDDILGIVYMDDAENMDAYKIMKHTSGKLAFQDEEGFTFNLYYQGDHEISTDFIQLVVDNLGNKMGGETTIYEADSRAQRQSDLADFKRRREKDKRESTDYHDYGSYDDTEDEEYTTKGESTQYDYGVDINMLGSWKWTGPNGHGTIDFYPNGVYKLVLNGQNPGVHFFKYEVSGNTLTQYFFTENSTIQYELTKLGGGAVKVARKGTNDSWTYAYQGEAKLSYNDEKKIESLLDSDRLKNPGRELSRLRPDNLSLVGCWEDANDISDPWVFDSDGFWRTGDFNSYSWGYEGFYNFDGRTLTLHVHSGGGLTMDVGETYTFEIDNLSSSRMTFDRLGYRSDYRNTNRYRITEKAKSKIQTNLNTKQLEDTKWTSDSDEYLFLSPNYLIIRKNGHSYQKLWHFNGNTLWIKEVSGRDDDYTSLGKVTDWTKDKLKTDKYMTFRSGHKVADLNTNEQMIYMNYLKLNHLNWYQAMIGVGGIYEIQWNY